MSEGITFGGWLKQRRRESGITQEELAESIGCSGTAIRKIEVGERHPSGQIAHLLSDYFVIPADEREAFIAFARSGRSAQISPQAAPGDTGTRAPWRNAYLHQTNLPTVLTRLIGRDQEATAAHNFLTNSKVRLLTLTGAPGIGKTRLALQVASDLVDRFEDGVFLVELAAVVNPNQVLQAIARTFDLNEATDHATEKALLDYVRDRKMLLLLDNFEQVLDAATSIVKLLEASPWLKILITSREALHVRGERRLSVPPLGLPDVAPISKPEQDKVAHLLTYSSVRLFVERAQAVNPTFEMIRENSNDIAMLCRELEGLPLAIELAAARANHLTLAEMRSAVDNRLKLLTGGPRDLPARHRTLGAAIAWSYELLSDDEKDLFLTVGAFAGGGALPAFQAVSLNPHAPQLLLALVDKNLVTTQSPATNTSSASVEEAAREQPDETRFNMLEAIRQYAQDKLIAIGNAESVHHRHALYFLSLAREAQPHLASKYQKWWTARLTQEIDNFRAALTWTLEVPRAISLEIGLNLGESLWTFWARQGYVSEGKSWLERLFVRLDPRLSSADPTADNTTDLIQTLSVHPLSSNIVELLSGAGSLAMRDPGRTNAQYYLDLALALARGNSNSHAEASILDKLGSLSSNMGDFTTALSQLEDALHIMRSSEDWDETNIANTLTMYSWALSGAGRFADALQYEEESLSIKRRLGDTEGVGRSLLNLAEITRRTGDYEASSRYAENMLQIARDLGNLEGEAYALRTMGAIAWMQGRHSDAQTYLLESLTRFQDLEQQNGALDCIARLAQVASAKGQIYRAGMLAGAHVALHTVINTPQLAVDTGPESTFALLRLQDETTWANAWATGQAMTMPEVIDYLLNAE